MRRGSSLRQRFGRASAKRTDRTPPFGLNVLQFHGLRAAAGDDDQVNAIGKDPGREAEALPAQTLDPVTNDGTAHLATHDEADARPKGHGLRGDEKDEVPRDDATPLRLGAPEVGLPTQPARTIERRAQ